MKYTTKTKTILAALCSASVLLLGSCNDSSSGNNDTSEDASEPAAPSIPTSLAGTSFENPSYTASPAGGTFSIQSFEITSSSNDSARSSDSDTLETGTFKLTARGLTSSGSSTSTYDYNYSNIGFTYNPNTGVFVSDSCTLTGGLEGSFTMNLLFGIGDDSSVPVSGSVDVEYRWLNPSKAYMVIDETSWAISKQD